MNEPLITMVVATDLKGAIGKGNSLPWRHKGDMASFKRLTVNRAVLMGGKTFRAVGCLPKRHTIVLTRDPSQYADVVAKFPDRPVVFVSTPEEALQHSVDNVLMVIGGAEIYKLFQDRCHCVIRSKIDVEVDVADAFFTMEFPDNKWNSEIVEFPPSQSDPNDAAWTLYYHYRKI